jgi:hypothetical protein
MRSGLEDLTAHLAQPETFARLILTDLCEQCVALLSANMYGGLGQEWTFTVAPNGRSASVFHTRLEGDREQWEIIFHAHNSGSRRYMIYPKNALALSWTENGQRFFSKGHEVGGIVGKFFAEKCERLIADYQNTLERKWARWCETGKIT